MTKRLEKFESYSAHAWLRKSFLKLSDSEKQIARDFIARNDSLDRGEFEKLINRMFLDREKPKNWTVILELLANCNSSNGGDK